jgi:hypothetical protein
MSKSIEIEAVTFNKIDANKWDKDDNKEYIRMVELRAHLMTLSALWNKVAGADAAVVTTEYKKLQESKIKIVDLNGIDPETKVFLGGSRKKRQSKKRKNHKNHNNNQ